MSESKTDNGGAAFPQHGWTSNPEVLETMKRIGLGMSVRDVAALAILQGMITSLSQMPLDAVAKAFDIAEEFVAERRRRENANG